MPAATPTASAPIASRSAKGKGVSVDPLAQSLAAEYLVEQEEQRAAAALGQRGKRPWRRIIAVAAIVTCGAVWLVPSLGTRRIAASSGAASAQRQDGAARLSLVLAAQRVRDYQRRYGRLPATLNQAGVSDTLIAYRLTGDGEFVLSLSQGAAAWDLSSTAADSAYMRDALSRLGIVPKAK